MATYLAQRGDREAFGLLYDRYVLRVYGYCLRLLHDQEAAEDATTEAFLRALAGLPTYRAGSFRSWLFGIAHHVATDHLRHQGRTISLHLTPEVVDPHDVEASALVATEWARLARVLPQLSPDQQEVIALRLAGLTAVEIGTALGKPRNAIDGLHHRAVLRLKALLAPSAAAVRNNRGGESRG